MKKLQKPHKLPDHSPEPRFFREKIGDVEYLLEEANLDAFDDVTLWSNNPRLLPFIAEKQAESESDLEAYFQRTRGYDALRKSIEEIGQLEHVYVWKSHDMSKYLVLEGGTRVTIKRELARKKAGTPGEALHRKVKAKILPAEFTEEQRVVLLARIHVRGTGVREWGRYIEAKFIYENTTPMNGRTAVMTVPEMARWMGKSTSWVNRLRDAYVFGQQYVEHLDSPDAPKKGIEHFSTLEEIIKSSGFGPRLKGNTPESETLRTEVFDMVTAEVFKEYRDARFMKAYFDDPEKWARLKVHEKWVANQLANEIKAGTSSTIKGRIGGLCAQIDRTLDRDADALNLDDLEELQKAVSLLASRVAGDVGPFRIRLQEFVKALYGVPLDEVKKVTAEEYQQLKEGLADFQERWQKHTGWSDGGH